MSVVVDAEQPLKLLADTAAAWCTSVDVLVEINAGQDRCVRACVCVGGGGRWRSAAVGAMATCVGPDAQHVPQRGLWTAASAAFGRQ